MENCSYYSRRMSIRLHDSQEKDDFSNITRKKNRKKKRFSYSRLLLQYDATQTCFAEGSYTTRQLQFYAMNVKNCKNQLKNFSQFNNLVFLLLLSFQIKIFLYLFFIRLKYVFLVVVCVCVKSITFHDIIAPECNMLHLMVLKVVIQQY